MDDVFLNKFTIKATTTLEVVNVATTLKTPKESIPASSLSLYKCLYQTYIKCSFLFRFICYVNFVFLAKLR